MATSARTKTKNKPSLKSQDAGYSTTNSKGVTTYYKSAKDAPGYYDTANGKNVKTSPGKPLSRVNAAGTAIPVSDLTPAAPVPMPSTPIPTDPGNIVGANNAGLATASNGMLTFDATSNQLVPNAQGTTPTATDNFSSLFNQYMGMQEAPPSTADIYNKMPEKAAYEDAVKERNKYASQITAITNKAQADQLRLEGQGRGITDVIIGGQQAQINREAAIQALPIQAQLAAAQGDVEMAQQMLTTMFQIKSQDALAQYQYKSKIVDAVYNFATAGEQRRLDALKAKEDRAYDMQKTNMSIANDWAKTALEYGQSGIASKLMALDTSSPTFSQDFAALTARVQKPVAPKEPKAPTTQVIDGKLYQYDYETGAWNIAVGGGASVLSETEKKDVRQKVSANTEIRGLIQQYKTLLDDVGYEGSTWGSTNLGKYDALRGRITTALKKAEQLGTLDNGVLTLVNQLIGESPEKGGLTQNLLGFKSNRVSSSLQTQLDLIDARIAEDKLNLGDYKGIFGGDYLDAFDAYWSSGDIGGGGYYNPYQYVPPIQSKLQ